MGANAEKKYEQYIQGAIEKYKTTRKDLMIKFRNTTLATQSRKPDTLPPEPDSSAKKETEKAKELQKSKTSASSLSKSKNGASERRSGRGGLSSGAGGRRPSLIAVPIKRTLLAKTIATAGLKSPLGRRKSGNWGSIMKGVTVLKSSNRRRSSAAISIANSGKLPVLSQSAARKAGVSVLKAPPKLSKLTPSQKASGSSCGTTAQLSKGSSPRSSIDKTHRTDPHLKTNLQSSVKSSSGKSSLSSNDNSPSKILDTDAAKNTGSVKSAYKQDSSKVSSVTLPNKIKTFVATISSSSTTVSNYGESTKTSSSVGRNSSVQTKSFGDTKRPVSIGGFERQKTSVEPMSVNRNPKREKTSLDIRSARDRKSWDVNKQSSSVGKKPTGETGHNERQLRPHNRSGSGVQTPNKHLSRENSVVSKRSFESGVTLRDPLGGSSRRLQERPKSSDVGKSINNSSVKRSNANTNRLSREYSNLSNRSSDSSIPSKIPNPTLNRLSREYSTLSSKSSDSGTSVKLKNPTVNRLSREYSTLSNKSSDGGTKGNKPNRLSRESSSLSSHSSIDNTSAKSQKTVKSPRTSAVSPSSLSRENSNLGGASRFQNRTSPRSSGTITTPIRISPGKPPASSNAVGPTSPRKTPASSSPIGRSLSPTQRSVRSSISSSKILSPKPFVRVETRTSVVRVEVTTTKSSSDRGNAAIVILYEQHVVFV
ncbi:micronuclear linker histone polyprotein-like [Macrobrachium rosenbergii]|uniref:micronuclear linker histone polyprotein-like n=1 Tax=Macrobrachium rosenbergii TaxID=79674 RepID=UPI0034D39304